MLKDDLNSLGGVKSAIAHLDAKLDKVDSSVGEALGSVNKTTAYLLKNLDSLTTQVNALALDIKHLQARAPNTIITPPKIETIDAPLVVSNSFAKLKNSFIYSTMQAPLCTALAIFLFVMMSFIFIFLLYLRS
jgi:hypothetical protein